MLNDQQDVPYYPVRDYGDEYRMLRDIALPRSTCTREALDRLGRQLIRERTEKPVVAVSIVDHRGSVLDGDNGREDTNGRPEVDDHLRALYVGNAETGLHELIVYPDREQSPSQVIRYSYCVQDQDGW